MSISFLSDTTDKLKENAGAVADKIKDKAGDLKDQAVSTFDSLKEKAGDLYDKVTDETKDRVIDPTIEAGKRAVSAVREGAGHVSDYTRQSLERSEKWATANPFTAGAILFAAGIFVGAALGMSRTRQSLW